MNYGAKLSGSVRSKKCTPNTQKCISCTHTRNVPVYTSNYYTKYFDNRIKPGVDVHLIIHSGLILVHLFIFSEWTVLHVSASKHRTASECHNSASGESN